MSPSCDSATFCMGAKPHPAACKGFSSYRGLEALGRVLGCVWTPGVEHGETLF